MHASHQWVFIADNHIDDKPIKGFAQTCNMGQTHTVEFVAILGAYCEHKALMVDLDIAIFPAAPSLNLRIHPLLCVPKNNRFTSSWQHFNVTRLTWNASAGFIAHSYTKKYEKV